MFFRCIPYCVLFVAMNTPNLQGGKFGVMIDCETGEVIPAPENSSGFGMIHTARQSTCNYKSVIMPAAAYYETYLPSMRQAALIRARQDALWRRLDAAQYERYRYLQQQLYRRQQAAYGW